MKVNLIYKELIQSFEFNSCLKTYLMAGLLGSLLTLDKF